MSVLTRNRYIKKFKKIQFLVKEQNFANVIRASKYTSFFSDFFFTIIFFLRYINIFLCLGYFDLGMYILFVK